MKLVSLWKRNPIQGWEEAGIKEYRYLQELEYGSVEAVISSICECSGYAYSTVSELYNNNLTSHDGFVHYAFKVKSIWQLEHADYNQAESYVKFVVKED